MTNVGIVGAGAGAATVAYVLDGAVPDVEITVLEKSGGVCGRAATRRRGDVTYEYGANYLKDDDERVTDLVTETLDDAGLVDVTDPVWVFDAEGTVSEGRDADEHKWTYRTGITQIAKRLFGETDAEINHHTRVETLARDGEQFHVTDAEGTEWGPFDVLVLNPPAPQTATLLETADWNAPERSALAAAVDAVEYRQIWAAMLHYPFELDRPYYALVDTDKEHPVGWIAREECKPGHVPDGESLLLVQASPEWSAANADEAPADNVAELAELTAELLEDDRLTDPDWTDHQYWRYALPEGGVREGAVSDAEDAGLYCVGDWVAGEERLHAALRNGLDTGERLAYRL